MESECRDDLHDVFFLNDSIGWSYSYGTGLVLKTSNSGAVWKVVCRLDSVYYEQIQFVSPDVGWLCGGDGQLRRSHDGGYTWARVPVPRPPGVDLTLLYGMYFRNETDGLLAGGSLTYGGSEGHKYIDWDKGSYFILRTTDAGISWSPVAFPPATMLFAFQFFGDSSGFASGNNAIYRTSDLGKNWRVSFMDTLRLVGNIRAMYFVDSQRGYAASWNGYFLSTTDGGADWTATCIAKSHLRSVCFADAAAGYVVGNADETGHPMLMTRDSGKTWTPVLQGYGDLHRIRRTGMILWACGKNGTILKNPLGR